MRQVGCYKLVEGAQASWESGTSRPTRRGKSKDEKEEGEAIWFQHYGDKQEQDRNGNQPRNNKDNNTNSNRIMLASILHCFIARFEQNGTSVPIDSST